MGGKEEALDWMLYLVLVCLGFCLDCVVGFAILVHTSIASISCARFYTATLSTIVALLSCYLAFLHFLSLCVLHSSSITSTYAYIFHFYSSLFYTLLYDHTISTSTQPMYFHFSFTYTSTTSAYAHSVSLIAFISSHCVNTTFPM